MVLLPMNTSQIFMDTLINLKGKSQRKTNQLKKE